MIKQLWRIVGVAVSVVLAVVLAWLMLWRDYPVPHERQAIEWCRSAFAQAATPAESTAVDARRPTFSRGDAAAALTCGTRRAARQLDR